MGQVQAEMVEFECCPQYAGCLFEALDAAGVASGPDCATGRESTGGCGRCGSAEGCACA